MDPVSIIATPLLTRHPTDIQRGAGDWEREIWATLSSDDCPELSCEYPFCEAYPCGNTIVTVVVEQFIDFQLCTQGATAGQKRYDTSWSLRTMVTCND